MDIIQKIKELARIKDIPISELAEKIGFTNSGLHRAFANNDLKLSTLEKIANVLNVPMSSFFESGLLDIDTFQRKIVELNALKMAFQQKSEKYNLMVLVFNDLVSILKKSDPNGNLIKDEHKQVLRIVFALCSQDLRPEVIEYFNRIGIE